MLAMTGTHKQLVVTWALTVTEPVRCLLAMRTTLEWPCMICRTASDFTVAVTDSLFGTVVAS